MWFVVSAESPRLVEQTMDQIADQAGLTVYRFPKAYEFYVGLFLELGEEGEVATVSRSRGESTAEYALSSIDRDLVVACQDGLPVIPEPYAEIARQVSLTEEDLHVRLRRLLRHGVVRRIGAIPNHYRLGLRANSMTVWNIVDERAVALGERVGALPFVSHCYLRPRYPGVWEYNLFAMVHGPDRGSVERKRARIRELLGPHLLDEDSLYSTEILKKSGLRLAA